MALLQVSVMLTGLHSGDLMLGIECCRIFARTEIVSRKAGCIVAFVKNLSMGRPNFVIL